MSNVHKAREALGQQLRDLRRDAGLTGRQLADLAAWHPSKVTKIEYGKQTPTEDDIRKWCEHTAAEGHVSDLVASATTHQTHRLSSVKIERNPRDVHAPVAAYTHQIEIGPGGRWLVLSGQIGMRVDGSVPESVVEQIEVALENVGRNLSAAGMSVTDLVKVTVFLVGQVDSAARRTAFADFLGSHEPCMTLMYVSGLAAPSLRVEIDVMAWSDAAKDGE
ncbi:Rid family hydrolase [Nocardia sp. NPDC051030]|uniref:Rid family hydrolase n=1 Tax=Nocardia sp. NPDC051030 TaxID=3155162 RepID=UPI0034282210